METSEKVGFLCIEPCINCYMSIYRCKVPTTIEIFQISDCQKLCA